uniref:Uncharacterized protein n=2 Tax=Oryza TaxID=4527 RepID=Q2R938_ORYSJ|nr:hypothetical protein LOC_Os11g10080 [Oryza sativa Japonica Group]
MANLPHSLVRNIVSTSTTLHPALQQERGRGGGEGARSRVRYAPSEEQEDAAVEHVFVLEMGLQLRRRKEGKDGEWRGKIRGNFGHWINITAGGDVTVCLKVGGGLVC